MSAELALPPALEHRLRLLEKRVDRLDGAAADPAGIADQAATDDGRTSSPTVRGAGGGS